MSPPHNILFTHLFRFTKSEVDALYTKSSTANRVLGLKLIKQTTPNTLDHGKLLIVIPRRVGSAVIRNSIRRRLKAIYYENKLYSDNAIYGLFVYPEANKLSFNDLKNFLMKTSLSTQK